MAKEKTTERYQDMTVDELRKEARRAGISGASSMRKQELVDALRKQGGGGRKESLVRDEERGGSTIERGSGSSKSLKYAQEIRSPDEHEERPGRSLVTRNHEVIQGWAEDRGATPATVPGTEHGDRPGVLRFNFPGYGGQDLQEISWDEWFRTFDERKLNFIYQEHKSDGTPSNFFRLENPEREEG